ncbi:tetratricopeptide repeat protein [Bryobacter aggregatus]|uniref:tetratricopeptide repeat protein n=1 Tax=Bryobacter aggregatus TaxID=360054 RepID=UPI0004E2482C|nr:tetratricopeptide repeat protein [Bryobacter aggregatus]
MFPAILVLLLVAQNPTSSELMTRAGKAFAADDFVAAERDLRAVVQMEPSNFDAQSYLGHALFRQEKYQEAIAPYEKALALEGKTKKLVMQEHRILIDQLVMSYGLTGNLAKVHRLLDEAIQRDPEYPLNYYNRACAFAEAGEKQKALTNLELAFARKKNILKGEQMPEPLKDSSFQRYLRDADFLALMKKLGLG